MAQVYCTFGLITRNPRRNDVPIDSHKIHLAAEKASKFWLWGFWRILETKITLTNWFKGFVLVAETGFEPAIFVDELMIGLTEYFAFYNIQRPHESLGQITPDVVYRSGIGGGAMILDKYLWTEKDKKTETVWM